MKSKWLLLFVAFINISVYAQQQKPLSIKQAVETALTNSDEAKLADTKVTTAENELQTTKNLQYPDLEISGQYQHLFQPDIDLQVATGESSSSEDGFVSPDVTYLMLGQASLSVPIFSGFKIQNSIDASENIFQSTKFDALSDKERVALQTIIYYVNLYKAQQTVELFKENLKSAQQRVKDFSAMEENGLLARNDLLKAKLQESNIQLSLEESQKNVRMLNYKLATFLKQPTEVYYTISENNFGISEQNIHNTSDSNRPELASLQYKKEASENNIKIAESNYYPSLALVGGYVAADLDNIFTINQAVNVGVGLSYDLTGIFKNKSEVRVAKSKSQEIEHSLDILQDKIKIEIENAQQDYQLALRKFEVYSQSVEQAEENYRIVKDKYDNGLEDTNDLLEADVQQLQAKINLTYAKAEITLKKYQLYKAEGNLINQFN